ncbi:MAG: radical SAM protein [Clostridiales bacterium]|nr:radical SAM protein [Clostridiales bacterium]
MNSLKQDLWNSSFSHIYVEEGIQHSKKAKEILQRFPNAAVIPIKHYKDIFNRNHQNFHVQALQRKLILAKNSGQLIFQGAPVCQNFGEKYFYYTSNILNCIYNCEYCYLQGMYPSANLVVFLNLWDNFKELESLLKEHPVYVCISYDTDLLALENIFHFLSDWISFAKLHPNLTIEVRTKSAQTEIMRQLEPLPNIIYAWTLSPDEIQKRYEHNTPSLANRLTALLTALSCGHQIRICFDPLLNVPNALNMYQSFIKDVFSVVNPDKLYDISLGLFRISKDYLKQLRKAIPNSSISAYPYIQSNGYCHYEDSVIKELLIPIYQQLLTYLPKEKIFIDPSVILNCDR